MNILHTAMKVYVNYTTGACICDWNVSMIGKHYSTMSLTCNLTFEIVYVFLCGQAFFYLS